MGVQVQSATKNGQGESLSILNRQFISFSYGGRNIEDFDLLAVFSNDRLDKEIYAPFNDTTTEQAELDGQMFWRSNFKAGQLSFTLATDGMTSAQLEDFKHWFQPGVERELILSEYHNRYAFARIASSPHMSLLPFEKKIKVKIGNTYRETSVSLYKGEIKLDFVMDEPYWFAEKNYFDEVNLTEKDVKVILEDGIPHLDMLDVNCFLAGNHYYQNGIVTSTNNVQIKGDNSKIDQYLYYCGTASVKPKISFDLFLNKTSEGLLSIPFKAGEEDNYPYLAIGSGSNYKKLKFGLPSIFTSYNQAINIVSTFLEKGGTSILDLRAELRDQIHNYYTRSFIIGIIDAMKAEKIGVSIEGVISSNFRGEFIERAKKYYLSSNPLHCEINCKTGEVIIKTKILSHFKDSTFTEVIENAGNMIKSNYLIIDTRMLPEDGRITGSQCLIVTTNSDLANVKIDYHYMYL